MKSNSRKILAAIVGLGLAGLAFAPLVKPLPLLIWNASNSIPVGWYFVLRTLPQKGEIAVLKPTGWVELLASERRYLSANVWLLKPVVALEPSIICRFGKYVFIDGKLVTKAQIIDKLDRQMPVWRGCTRLEESDFFLLSHHPDSFDSRYFGPVKRDQVIGTAIHLTFLGK